MSQEIVTNIGNQLNRVTQNAKESLFLQGELTQLSYLAFDYAAKTIRDGDQKELEISYPVGYSLSKEAIPYTHKYKKEELIARYNFLANAQLGLNGVYRLVTIIEAMLGDLIRAIVMKYPDKLGSKRSISTGIILAASSLEEIHLHAVESLLNDLSYKSPHDFAKDALNLMSVNLLECPAYHRYTEIKATRDIHIHNGGIANEIYVTKAGSHARVLSGDVLPVDAVYFLESYESCLQLSEWIEKKLHDIWPSSEYEARIEADEATSSEPQLPLGPT